MDLAHNEELSRLHQSLLSSAVADTYKSAGKKRPEIADVRSTLFESWQQYFTSLQFHLAAQYRDHFGEAILARHAEWVFDILWEHDQTWYIWATGSADEVSYWLAALRSLQMELRPPAFSDDEIAQVIYALYPRQMVLMEA